MRAHGRRRVLGCGQHLRELVGAVLPAGEIREPAERRGESQAEVRLGRAALATPSQRGAQVVALECEPGQPASLAGPAELWLGAFGDGREVPRVLGLRPLVFAGVDEPLVGVVAQGLEHAKAITVDVVGDDQGMVDQLREHVEDLRLVNAGAGADVLGGLEAPAAAEHRQPAKQHAFRLFQQLVAPVDGRAECLLPPVRRVRPGAQKPKTVTEARRDLRDRNGLHARGSQLDRSGMPSSWRQISATTGTALGVDYNIFLMVRAREETLRHGNREGAIRALAATGTVITSAGLVLAGTFSILGVLPLVPLTQIGFTVAFGVLLDTFVVRSVLVPALVVDVGAPTWWPSRLARGELSSGTPPEARPGERRHDQPAAAA